MESKIVDNYESVTLHQSLLISKLFTVHYFEYMNDFSFPGEAHNFWEFLCVDKGEVDVVAGSRSLSLKKDEIIFHKPNEFHTVRSNGRVAPNVVVISFECTSPSMDFFKDRILTIGEAERSLIAQIIMEARQLFSCPLDDPYLKKNGACGKSALRLQPDDTASSGTASDTAYPAAYRIPAGKETAVHPEAEIRWGFIRTHYELSGSESLYPDHD